MDKTVDMTLVDEPALDREIAENIQHGRAFVPGCTGVETGDACVLAVRYPPTGAVVRLEARAVWVTSGGVGFELPSVDVDEIRAMVRGSRDAPHVPLEGDSGEEVDLPPGVEPLDEAHADSLPTGTATMHRADLADDPPSSAPATRGGSARPPRNVQERMRGLSLREQSVVARTGSLTERVALERVYGAAVWEHLLQNPQLTPPEVGRISKKGNLPKPLLATICGNRSWLASPEVQRALLSNPRLDGINLTKVLRALSKPDLQKVPKQTAYRFAVRDAAKRMLR